MPQSQQRASILAWDQCTVSVLHFLLSKSDTYDPSAFRCDYFGGLQQLNLLCQEPFRRLSLYLSKAPPFIPITCLQIISQLRHNIM